MNLKKLLLLSALASGLLSLPVQAEKNEENVKLLGKVEKQLVDATGKKAKATVTGKDYVFIYYSAHWCPPCRAFTPELVKFYNEKKDKASFELIFVSSDKGEKEMQEYMKTTSMPWVAVDFADVAKSGIKKFCGSGIPCLVLLDKDRNVVADSFDGKKYLGPRQVLEKFNELIDKPKAEAADKK